MIGCNTREHARERFICTMIGKYTHSLFLHPHTYSPSSCMFAFVLVYLHLNFFPSFRSLLLSSFLSFSFPFLFPFLWLFIQRKRRSLETESSGYWSQNWTRASDTSPPFISHSEKKIISQRKTVQYSLVSCVRMVVVVVRLLLALFLFSLRIFIVHKAG